MKPRLRLLLIILVVLILIGLLIYYQVGQPKEDNTFPSTWVIGGNSAPYVSGYSDPSDNTIDIWYRAFDKLYADYKILEESYNRLQQEGYDAFVNKKLSDNFTLRITEYTPTDNISWIPRITVGEYIPPIYIDRVIEKVVTVTNNVCLEQLMPFNNIAELREWVNQWQYNPNLDWIHSQSGNTATTTFDSQANDCDKYSRQMVESGIHDGYLMGLVVDTGKQHMLVFALIGGKIHFIEPQNKAIYNVLNDSYWELDEK